jgi:3-hydroxybutyryl-CoA dehydrogenase
MTVAEIKTVCYVGAGTMGCANSLVAAISGYDVVLYDLDQNTLDQVAARHAEMGPYLVSIGYCTADELAASTARITCTRDLAAATANADLVSESVIEDLDIKRAVHAELDSICPPQTILTTNTSGMLVSDIEDVVSRGERFAALHSHFGSLLIDIVGGPRTSEKTFDILMRYVISAKCVPLVLKKENRGYVLNSLIGPVVTAAMLLEIQGLATKEQIDRAWMVHRKAPMGPFGMMDLFGLNVVYDGWQHQPEDGKEEAYRPVILGMLEAYMSRGELGAKTGQGFYSYPNPVFEQDGFLQAEPENEVAHYALTTVLVGQSIVLVANGVADPDEVDRAWKAGMNLDIGPFEIMDQMPPGALRELIRKLPGTLAPDDIVLIEKYLDEQEREAVVS